MLWNKLKNKKAETLLETLVSILVAVLSVTLLATSVMVAARINKTTGEADARFNEELGEAELGAVLDIEDSRITVRFDNGSTENVLVDIYGTGEFASYKKGGDAP